MFRVYDVLKTEVLFMARIILSIRDEQKAKRLLALLGDLDYVDTQVEDTEKKWEGYLPVFDSPVFVPGFTMFTREALHER